MIWRPPRATRTDSLFPYTQLFRSWAAARASCAMPGLFTPVKHEDRWMLDGGLVNPVPVSACRALGADVVIAVNLNAQLVGSHMSSASRDEAQRAAAADAKQDDGRNRSFWNQVVNYLQRSKSDTPSFLHSVARSAERRVGTEG